MIHIQTTTWKIIFWFWAGLVFLLSVIPNTPHTNFQVRGLAIRIDYFSHFIIYALLSLFFVAWKRMNPYFLRQLTIFACLAPLFSAVNELLQLLVPGRGFSLMDIVFNISGLLCGVLLTLKTRIGKPEVES